MPKKICKTILFLLIPVISIAQTFEMNGKDTVNFTNADGIKHGNWIYFDTQKKTKLSRGKYIDGLKQGLWTEYYPSGIVKNEINYTNNRKKGYAKVYYENGNLKEEGIWDENKWTGQYKFYYENGNPYYAWNYNNDGQRTGRQQYFHENGKIKIEGQWNEGKETGTIKEYDETGTLLAEKIFENGVFDAASSKDYSASADNTIIIQNNKQNEVREDTDNTKKNSDVGVFSGDGYRKFYNSAKQTEKEGEFKNGYLISGKRFFYNQSGKLIKTEIYENGKVIQSIIHNQ